MSVRQAMVARLAEAEAGEARAGRVSLPQSLRSDRKGVRVAMLQRLAASRLFAIGDKAGVLRTAQRRSGRPFRLDVRQRVIVKALVSRHIGRGPARGEALAKHVAYLGRSGAGAEGARPGFFDRSENEVDAGAVTSGWTGDRHHFRFIISPEHGDRIADLEGYTREVMQRVAADLGQPDLDWIGACHFDTDQPHAHVLIRGRRGSDGKDLVIPRDYIAYGFRSRAQEVAHELLGDLSRMEAERRIWRETQADRFTGFDRRLMQGADANLEVEDGVGATEAWAALTRGRLRHLEALGLATRHGHRYRLHPELEVQLRTLQLRRDVIRSLHQRRLETGQAVREIGEQRLRGRLVKVGHYDELGASPWVIVRDQDGLDHFARLRLGHPVPAVGRAVQLVPSPHGAQISFAVPGRDLGRG